MVIPNRMPVKKIAVSLEEALASEIQRAAEEHAQGNVSAWLAEAARQRLRQHAARELLQSFEDEFGTLTAAEREKARKRWPRD